MKLRVLLVAPLPPPVGGICVWTEILLTELKWHDNVEVTIVDITPRWRTVHQLEAWRRILGGGIQLINDARQVFAALRRNDYDVLHLCTSGKIGAIRDLVVLGIAKLFKIPTTYHIHFGRIPDLARTGGAEWWLIRRASSMANVVIALDLATTATMQMIRPPDSVIQLPNCLDGNGISMKESGNSSCDRKPDVLRVTFIGHVMEAKGVRELVEAAKRLSSELRLEIEIIGPPDNQYMNRILAEAGDFIPSILIRGERTHAQAMDLLRQSDLLALPSYTEGFPYVVLEAMALRKPVVATDVGAIPEMLGVGTERACGIVVPPRDVESLTVALREVLGNPTAAASMGANGQWRFQNNFTSAVVVNRLCSIWLELSRQRNRC